jgi:prolyl 4-hydroxylase
MKWRGGIVPQDLGQARALYGRAGNAGHILGAAYATNLLASGIAGPRDWPAALQRLRKEGKADPGRRRIFDLIAKMKLTPAGDPASPPQPRSLSTEPHVTLFPQLFSGAECDYLRRLADPLYEPSVVYDSAGRLVRDPIRTSDGATIHWLIEDPAVHALNRRLAAATGTDADQGEAMQILRYVPGQQYRSHLDFVRSAENQRAQTALVYLNHDYEGGETSFVKTGLNVKGRKGDVLVFRSALPDRRPDPLSEHAGLPVTSGTKFLASRWIRERRWSP